MSEDNKKTEKVEATNEKPDTDTAADTAEVSVTLSNGVETTLEIYTDREEWSYDTLQAQMEGNTAGLVNGILTEESRARLRFSRAKVKDFRIIAEAVGEQLGFLNEG